MSKFDEQYLSLCEEILEHGEKITTDPSVLKKKTDFAIVLLPDACAPVKTVKLSMSISQLLIGPIFFIVK